MKHNLKYLDCFLYGVETHNDGNKYIHLFGYCYKDESYQCVEGTFCYIPLMGCDTEKADDAFDLTKQYQGRVEENDVIEFYKGSKELKICEVTKDTPDGIYVDY